MGGPRARARREIKTAGTGDRTTSDARHSAAPLRIAHVLHVAPRLVCGYVAALAYSLAA